MRRIINSTYVTLDGIISNPQDWPALDDPDGEGTGVQQELIDQCDAILLGKETYLSFAGVWRGQSGDPFTDRINAIPKHVVSTTLTQASWENSTIIGDDVPGAVAALKEEPGQDILTYGFGRLARMLMDHGLLDEIRLWIHPFFLGPGPGSVFLHDQAPAARLLLRDSRAMANGTVIHSYGVEPRA
ncbi:dihydrofolate reductase family protein [Paeniglutamicibacter psychrophenolicus]|uniref:dihydrofolate reductase family protein n=1 Tax=Paeniglutamicibacter psychrophenolicus TaxID=257454 RepID=UPI0027891F4D|nr:dihydrofolate reductase family protein [Paeniglutamicibacter psychrophenolicus]MDQ0093571.1 dihydrofolate reductase [Paeniglutamicibacter psychrophenolicus]